MQPNDAQLQHDITRAEQARAVLDSAALADAFATLERSFVEAWRTTHIDDTAAREKLFLAVHIDGKVRDQLARVVGDGVLAQRELKELADEITRAAERKRRRGVRRDQSGRGHRMAAVARAVPAGCSPRHRPSFAGLSVVPVKISCGLPGGLQGRDRHPEIVGPRAQQMRQHRIAGIILIAEAGPFLLCLDDVPQGMLALAKRGDQFLDTRCSAVADHYSRSETKRSLQLFHTGVFGLGLIAAWRACNWNARPEGREYDHTKPLY